jgi:hypothetical protein
MRIDVWIQHGLRWSADELDVATLSALETLWAERDRALAARKPSQGGAVVY